MITFKLAWPAEGLSQNSRGHWAKHAGVRKKARADAKRATKNALRRGKLLRDKPVHLHIYFNEPELKRTRDLQNLIGAMKYGVDGIADALGIDDSKFGLSFDWGVPEGDGNVSIVITTR